MQRVKDLKRIQYFAQFYHESGVANGTSTVSFHAFHKAVDKAGSMQNLLRWVSPRLIKETMVPAKDYRYPHMG